MTPEAPCITHMVSADAFGGGETAARSGAESDGLMRNHTHLAHSHRACVGLDGRKAPPKALGRPQMGFGTSYRQHA